MRKNAMLCVSLMSILAGPAAAGQAAVEINVSATVPPRPCEFPERCPQVTTSSVSRVAIRDGKIRYVGSAPAVDKRDDLLIVRF